MDPEIRFARNSDELLVGSDHYRSTGSLASAFLWSGPGKTPANSKGRQAFFARFLWSLEAGPVDGRLSRSEAVAANLFSRR